MNELYITKSFVAILACLLLFSCSNEDDSGILPAGEYPMAFNAVVERQLTRSTSTGSWDGGEDVAIQVVSTVKKYTAATDGKLSATSGIEPFFWQNSNDTKTVTGWYPYSASVPTSWSVQSDQSIGGYQQSDFMYAPAVAISFANRETTTLPFYHQTARVVVNIMNGEAVLSSTDISAVKIGVNNNFALSANYTAPAGNNSQGTWSNLTNGGIVTPKEISPTGTFLKSYAALVIPQDMSDKKFIAVTLSNGNTYYYSPNTGDADLKGGKQYTYNITVKNSDIAVDVSDITDWTGADDVSTPGTSEPIKYKVGDYYPDPNVDLNNLTEKAKIEGIVYWVDPSDSHHGKIVGLDEGTDLIWNVWAGDYGATNMTNGIPNMKAMYDITIGGSWMPFEAYEWVHAHNDPTESYSSLNATGVWYLPAKDELSDLYSAYDTFDKNTFNSKLTEAGGTALSSVYYWSSSENNSNVAWVVGFHNNGSTDEYTKSYEHSVRCFLAF
ncbi:MAG: fimbrillin family protein [Dysgonomonas sp.]|uniref:fimbrillin family protein n=1 Tax=Dysgonomonas sp. TaxID=1891233 RepID=UPI0039E58B0E